MTDRERSNEDALLIAYLREAAPALADLGTGPHPASATLAAYCRDELDEETSQHFRVHLFHCDECFGVVHQLELVLERERAEEAAEEAVRAVRSGEVRQRFPARTSPLERVLTFVLKAFPPPASPPAPSEALTLAAAPGAMAQATWVAYAEGETCMALTVTGGGELVATVESGGRPAEGATVVLVEVDPAGVETDRGMGITDEHGEVAFGASERFQSLLSAGSRSQLRVKLVLPPDEDTSE